MAKLNKTHKVMILIAVATILVTLISPFLKGIPLQTTGKTVTCNTVIRNPAFSDNIVFESVECKAEETLICGVDFLSLVPLFLFGQDDQVTLRLEAEGTTPVSKTVTLKESGVFDVSASLTEAKLSICVSKTTDRVKLKILESKTGMIFDTEEVVV